MLVPAAWLTQLALVHAQSTLRLRIRTTTRWRPGRPRRWTGWPWGRCRTRSGRCPRRRTPQCAPGRLATGARAGARPTGQRGTPPRAWPDAPATGGCRQRAARTTRGQPSGRRCRNAASCHRRRRQQRHQGRPQLAQRWACGHRIETSMYRGWTEPGKVTTRSITASCTAPVSATRMSSGTVRSVSTSARHSRKSRAKAAARARRGRARAGPCLHSCGRPAPADGRGRGPGAAEATGVDGAERRAP